MSSYQGFMWALVFFLVALVFFLVAMLIWSLKGPR